MTAPVTIWILVLKHTYAVIVSCLQWQCILTLIIYKCIFSHHNHNNYFPGCCCIFGGLSFKLITIWVLFIILFSITRWHLMTTTLSIINAHAYINYAVLAISKEKRAMHLSSVPYALNTCIPITAVLQNWMLITIIMTTVMKNISLYAINVKLSASQVIQWLPLHLLQAVVASNQHL